MIIKIDISPESQGSLNYNFEKCESIIDGKTEAKIIGGTADSTTLLEAKRHIDRSGYINKNPQLKLRFAHIKVSIDPAENLSNYLFNKIAKDVVNGLGYSHSFNPYIVFRHFDTGHPHIHIVLSRTNCFGKTESDSFDHYKAVSLSRVLEQKFNLTPAIEQKLDRQGIRTKGWGEAKIEEKNSVQSRLQVVRDIVSHTLESSTSFNDYLFNLHRKGVSIRFRVEKKEDESLSVGLSYNLSSKLGPKIKTPALPVLVDKLEASKLMGEIIKNGYAFDGQDKYYLTPNNQIRINNNPLPVEVLDQDYFCKASDLGPGAEWYKLKEKFPDSTQDFIFEDDMIPENTSEKKDNVWYMESTELYDAEESMLEQKFLLGIKDKTPGYILESINEGLDVYEILNRHSNKLIENEKDVLYGILELIENDELSYSSIASMMLGTSVEPEESALAANIENDFSPTVIDIPEEIDLIHNEAIETPISNEEETQLSKSFPIEELFVNGQGKVIERLLDEDQTLFKPVLKLLTPEHIQESGLELRLVDRIKSKVATELSTDSEFVKVTQAKLDDYVLNNHEQLDLFVRMSALNFTEVQKHFFLIKDEELKTKIEDRIDNDKLYTKDYLKAQQIDLGIAFNKVKESKDYSFANKIVEALSIPLLDFSKIDAKLFNYVLPEQSIKQVSERIELDRARSKSLFEYAFGHYLLDRVSGEFFDPEVIVNLKLQEARKKANNNEIDPDINLDQKPPKDKGLNLGF